VQLVEERCERFLRVDVDPRSRLVEHEQLGLTRKRLGDKGSLLLAPGQRRDRSPCERAEPDAVDCLIDEHAIVTSKAADDGM